jgi:hypothetical protein
LDSLAYWRRRLLRGAGVPWASPGEVAAFFGTAQRTLRSDALLVDLSDVFAWRVGQDGDLPAAMAARSRPGFALRTLLADDRARAVAAGATAAVAAGDAATPVLLSLPSPARWLAIAAQQAGGPAGGTPGPHHVEAAAMYVAGLLRAFATVRVDGHVLDEGAAPAGELADAERYQPVLNVAAHYGWPVWVRSDGTASWPQGRVPGVTGWLGRCAPEHRVGPWGTVVAPDAALEAGPPSELGDVVLAVVPETADPDAVMRWVARLA